MPRSIRDVALVVVLLGLCLALIFSYGKKSEIGAAEAVVYRVFRPLEQGVSGVKNKLASLWNNYVYLVGVQQENRALKEELSRLRREKAELAAREAENIRVRKLLDIKTRLEHPSVVAQIIGEDASGWFRTFFIDKGTDDGVFAGMPVTATEGLVGRISRSAANMAQVVLITDSALAVDCRVARTRDRGVLRGALEGGCALRYLSPRAQAQEGDEVITSGLDGVFPSGLPIGKIHAIRMGEQGLFLEALVTPSVDFAALDQVLVILSTRGGFDVQSWTEERP
jgi:rod shape-determining protein MreC